MNNHIIRDMSQAYNYKAPTAPRMSHFGAQTQINSRPKPRGSEPPIISYQLDRSSESSKTTKQTASNYQSQPRYYKPESSKNDLIQRVNIPQPAERGPSDRNQASLNKINECSSPRGEQCIVNKGHNWSMPTGPTSSGINKQAYLNKVETSSNQGYKEYASNYLQKAPSQQSPQSNRVTYDEASRGSQVPRFSDLGLMASDDEEPIVYQAKITSNGSSRSNKIGTRTMIQLNSEKEGFKRKDLLGSGSAVEKKILRQSGFRQTDFKKGKELGAGKFGKVNLVKHVKTGFVCAMKTVPKDFVKGENIINQFIRELKIQSCLMHPNIARLYGFFQDVDNIYLLMQLGSEGQLYKIMKQKKKFKEATTIYIIRQLCEAVKYLHNLNILHRDIKPQNIVITYGTMKLCDFGWAVCKGSELRSTFCGTPLYVSPQLLKGQQYDQKIDVWAIGILTYELLVGDIPFEIQCQLELVKIIKQDIAFPKDIDLTDQAKDFILKILKKNPEDRLKVQKLLEHPFLRRHVESSDIEL